MSQITQLPQVPMRDPQTWLCVARTQVAPQGRDRAPPLLAEHMERGWFPKWPVCWAGAPQRRPEGTTGTNESHKSSCSMVPEAGLDRRLHYPHRSLPLDSLPLVRQDALMKSRAQAWRDAARGRSYLLSSTASRPLSPSFWPYCSSTPFYKGAQIWE